MKRLSVLLIILYVIASSVSSYADEDYEYTAHDKLARGVFSMITFLLEIPITMYEISVEENPLMGILYGFPLGFGKGAIRLAVGTAEVFTTALPPFEPILKPEYLLFEPVR
ncbi:MAG: exosortase system-associated protein, TIGR04073 family [Candidatus Omnitrophica bacterium]|nr:exosortase system-associated protein, TIGR04073 family [Candidatus Omnitrophota bacterium]